MEITGWEMNRMKWQTSILITYPELRVQAHDVIVASETGMLRERKIIL